MKRILALLLVGLINSTVLIAQKELPYYQIPDPQGEFTPNNLTSRMIDGLGFRYHWACLLYTSDAADD